MGEVIELALGNALLSALLAVLAWAVHRHGRYPAIAHALWVLVLIKVITPPLVVIPVSVPVSLPLEALASAPGVDGTAAVGAAGALDPGHDPASISVPVDRVFAPLLLAWLAGSLIVLLVSVRRIRRFGALLEATAMPAPAPLPALAATVAGELGLRVAPPVQLTSARISPMTWFGRRGPRIILPAGLLGRIGAHELRWVLAHEMAHVRRRDYLVRWVEWLACVACWWNPVVWWARHELRLDEEDACDALVLERVAGAPRAYAGTLLNVVEVLARPTGRVPTMATGIDAARSLEHRIAAIVGTGPRRPAPRALVVSVSAVAVTIMVLGSGGGVETPLAAETLAVGEDPGTTPGAGSAFAPAAVERYSTVSTAVPVGMSLAANAYVGTAGADTYAGTSADETIRGRGGPDRLAGRRGRDGIDGGDGADIIRGGAGRDVLRGGSGDDVISGGRGRDRIHAGGGDDVVRAWSDGTADRIDCGAGRDRAVIDSTDTTARCETVVLREP